MFYPVSQSLINGIPQSLGSSDETSFSYGKRETWYSIKDGNWDDPNIWRTVSGRRGNDYPGSGSLYPTDDVYIRNVVRINPTAIIVNNLTIAPNATWIFNSALNVTINGNLQCYGTWDMNSFGNNVFLRGTKNFCNNFINATNSTVTYNRDGDQDVMDLPYYGLVLSTVTSARINAMKTVTNHLVCLGSLSCTNSGILNMGRYDLTVTGGATFNSNSYGGIIKRGSGNLLFKAFIQLNGNLPTLDWSGNPNVEYRSGILSTVAVQAAAYIDFGTGTHTFTTSNQTIAASGYNGTQSSPVWAINGNVVVSGAITVTVDPTYAIQFNGSLDGDNASSAFVNKGLVYFNNATTYTPMATLGTFNKDTFANTIGYIFNGGFTLPYTTYSSLTLVGTGTRVLQPSTILSANFIMSATTSAIVDLSTGSFTCTGTFTVGANAKVTKSSVGALLFIGQVGSLSNGINWDFSGNPTVELRGGINLGANTGMTFTGTNPWKFTTNNQTITQTSGTLTPTGTWSWLISGAITITTSATASTIVIAGGTIDGDNAGSTLDVRNTINYGNAVRPMVTNGVLQTNAGVNTFVYNKAGAQDVTGGTYRNMTLSTSGTKTLQGNVSVINTYSLTGTATKNNNGFTFGNP